MAQKIVVSFFMLLQIFDVCCRSIRVSLHDSEDGLFCGSAAHPCKTLQYAIRTIANENDTILIEGGIEYPFIYHCNSTIYVTKNIYIKKHPQSKMKPIITTNDFTYSVFTFTKETTHRLTLQELKFDSATVFNFTTSGDVFISHSIFNFSIGLTSNSQLANISAEFRHCVFEGFSNGAMNIYIFSRVTLNIVNTTFIGIPLYSNLLISSNKMESRLVVRIEKSKFLFCFLRVMLTHNIYSSLLIRDSVFSNTSSLKVQHVNNVTVVDTNFTGCIYAFYLINVAHGSIYNCNLINTDGLSTCYIVMSTIHIERCLFQNNNASVDVDGGAIAANRSIVLVVASKFVKNTAPTNGGAISLCDSMFNATKCYFKNNFAPLNGGTIYSIGKSTLYLYHTQIHGSSKLSLTGTVLYSLSNTVLHNVTIIAPNANSLSPLIYLYCLDYTICIKIQLKYLFQCPVNYKAISNREVSQRVNPMYSFFLAYCIQCPKGLFSTKSGYQYLHAAKLIDVGFVCPKCPSGALCDGGIKSSDNYWGFVNKKGEYAFLPCPFSYCCFTTNRKCSSYQTCAWNRYGVLCGKCEHGYTENFLSSNCIPSGNCKPVIFWIIFTAISFLYVVVMMYIKDVFLLLGSIVSPRKTRLLQPLIDGREYENNIENSTQIEYSSEYFDCEESDDFVRLDVSDAIPSYDYVNRSGQISGVIKIFFFFYQIELLLSVDAGTNETQTGWSSYSDFVSSIFNIRVISQDDQFQICPYVGMTHLGKEFVKFSFVLCTILLLIIIKFVYFLLAKLLKLGKRFRSSTSSSETAVNTFKVLFSTRIKCCFAQLLLFCFSTISIFAFKSIKCVSVKDAQHLYIAGHVICYQWWQYCMIVFIFVWIIPFSLSLSPTCHLLAKHHISANQCLLCLVFPPLLIYFLITAKEPRHENIRHTVEEKQLTLVMVEPFRKRKNKTGFIMWDGVLIATRLVCGFISTFILNPIAKIYIQLSILLILLFVHVKVQPYKEKHVNSLENLSLLVLCFLATVNIFWAYNYISNTRSIQYVQLLGNVLFFVRFFILVLPFVLLFMFCVYAAFKKCVRIYKYYILKQD